ncbi:signal transduction histidine kinase/ActR/RegA family two-component response regulator [Aminobacter lissarensis]|uniref:histidine kinase n=2 Tax=Aminobacter TaxID=31988 RepID=A0A8E1WII7_9HYPH|nr:hybrid sensor histidine kinase/response regulator [Aminobacter lissarensis]MBB6468005.1 signal transduction histidine kinase/ActR/RegA family two-component response regulator [Aminobacter lissarensis]
MPLNVSKFVNGEDFNRFARQLFNNLSVSQKVMTLIIVEIISYTIITAIALYQIHLMGSEIKQVANLQIPLLAATQSIREQIQDERLQIKDIVFYGDRVVYDRQSEETYIAARDSFKNASRIIEDKIAWSMDLINTGGQAQERRGAVVKAFAPRLLEKLERIRTANRATIQHVEKIFSHVEDGSFLMGMELLESVKESEGALLFDLDGLAVDLQDLKVSSVEYAMNVEQTSSNLTIIASFITVCSVIAFFFVVVKRNISRPLHVLTDAIASFHPLDEPIDSRAESDLMSRGDELGMVGRSFHDLKRALRAQGLALHGAKEAAEQANRAKSRFLAAASHDLRQPLHAMQMYLAVLYERIHDREALAIVADVQGVAVATGRLLNSLLDISQLEAGAVVPQREHFLLQDLFQRVSISYLPQAVDKGLELRVVRTTATVYSDPVLLERSLGNLLSNAIRYTTTGKVLLGCRRRGDDIAIQVWDTGSGIPKDQATAIFDDFHQLHNPERDRGQGLGLGLAIVRRLADCLGHSIEHSSSLQKGSYFGLVVKRGEPVVVRGEGQERAELPNPLVGLRVLLVEDDYAVADATTQLLNSWGCLVLGARTAEEALKIVDQEVEMPGIVIADYRLPGKLDGAEAIQRIHVALQTAIPAVIITGESDLAEIKELAKMGYLILRKPVRPAKLRRLITHHAIRRSSAAYFDEPHTLFDPSGGDEQWLVRSLRDELNGGRNSLG